MGAVGDEVEFEGVVGIGHDAGAGKGESATAEDDGVEDGFFADDVTGEGGFVEGALAGQGEVEYVEQ